MKSLIGKLVLFILGWKSNYPKAYNVNKCVMIAAPHTSNWDLVFSLAVFWEQKVPVKFFIKDSFTKGLHGWFFKMMGAIGVDRSKKGNLVQFAVETLAQNDRIVLMVPAEGTRSRVEKWKTGFYHIAKSAQLPVALGYLDYEKKIAGVGDLIHLTEDFNHDMGKIEAFYKTIPAKYPEKYNQKIF
jgi:1-acyl-sn-glycerol-3-phosphate acyltransferase